MKITIFRTKRESNTYSIANEEFDKFIERIKEDSREGYITHYRDVVQTLESPAGWTYYNRIPKVCPSCEYYKKLDGQREFRLYNGISMLIVEGLNNKFEIGKTKRQAALNPQVLCAFEGCDGHSVVIWTLATLPDGTLPKTEKLAELFCAQAYATSVRCLAPVMEYGIKIEAPALDRTCLLTVDAEPYINPHPVPFIIEQPTEANIIKLLEKEDAVSSLERLRPSAESYVTFTRMFNAAFAKAQIYLPNWRHGDNPQQMIACVADICAEAGLPEEEVATRLLCYFYKEREDEVRSTVNNIYAEYKGRGIRTTMSKHQIAALRLREFLNRRYEIRRNEVLQMYEFRKRHSMQFLFKELDETELNSIHHEACIEGIEPTFGEVDKLVHSAFIPKYNPIEEFINELPKWDGNDYISEVAAMVPNNNQHWTRLFKQWFLSMVAHWMNVDDTHANQTAPILIGGQGYRKSTFCRLLLPPSMQMFYTDSIDFRSKAEAERCLSRFLLVNVDEFDQLTESQFAFVKHLFQKTASTRRRMYSDTIASERRYASFIATTNQNEILNDPTGNRRYLCVEVTAPIHTEKPINHSQLYAQAKHLILDGERYWLNDEDERLINEYNRKFEISTPLEQMLSILFRKPTEGEAGIWLTGPEILEELHTLPTFDKKRDNNFSKLGRALKKLGFAKVRKPEGYKYEVVRK